MCLSLVICLYEYKLKCMFVCRNCKYVYMSRCSWFYVCMFFLYVYSGMYVYMSECVYVFMYLYACKSGKREGDKSLEGKKMPRRMLLLVSTIQYYYILQTDFDLQR